MRLFKYTNHFGVQILRDLRFKVTPPNELNDPFEFSPILLPAAVTQEHVRELILTASPRDLYEEMSRNGEKLPSFDTFERLVQSVPSERVANAVPMFQKSYEQLVADNLNSVSQIVGLVCLSEEENNLLMWSHYTDSHRGLLIEFDPTHSYFKENSKFVKVTYGNQRVPFNPAWPDGSPEIERHCFEVLRTKNTDWAYEKEWRSLFSLSDCHKTATSGRILYFTDFPPELIVGVVLGYRCPVDVEHMVHKAKKIRNLSFPVYRSVLHSSEFKVEYKLL